MNIINQKEHEESESQNSKLVFFCSLSGPWSIIRVDHEISWVTAIWSITVTTPEGTKHLLRRHSRDPEETTPTFYTPSRCNVRKPFWTLSKRDVVCRKLFGPFHFQRTPGIKKKILERPFSGRPLHPVTNIQTSQRNRWLNNEKKKKAIKNMGKMRETPVF